MTVPLSAPCTTNSNTLPQPQEEHSPQTELDKTLTQKAPRTGTGFPSLPDTDR